MGDLNPVPLTWIIGFLLCKLYEAGQHQLKRAQKAKLVGRAAIFGSIDSNVKKHEKLSASFKTHCIRKLMNEHIWGMILFVVQFFCYDLIIVY